MARMNGGGRQHNQGGVSASQLATAQSGQGRDLIATPTQAQMLASTAPARGTGAKWYADGYEYSEAPAVVTDHDLITAGGVKLYAQPTGGCFETNQFSGGIGAKFNKAVAASRRQRVSPASTVWWPETVPILINPGVYVLDEQLRVEGLANLSVMAWGVVLNSFSSAVTPFWVVNCPRLLVEGLFINLRNNNNVSEAVMVAGQCSWATFRNVGVQCNTSNTDYASFRLKQGSIAGFDDADRNKGNFWVRLEKCWVRKLSGADSGDCKTCVDLQGCQNAFKAIDCQFTSFVNGIVIRDQNGVLSSGISNAPQIAYCDFEGFTGIGIYFKSALALSIAGGSAIGCRFEAGETAFQSDYSSVPTIPFQIFGSTVISSVNNYTVDARAVKDSFATLDASITPSRVASRHISARGVFFGATDTTSGTIRAQAKQASVGGSFVLERLDGTIDGKISQRPGGGLEIDGGATARVRISGINSLSGSTTHAANFRGNITLPAAATSIAVTLPNAEADASYAVAIDMPYNAKAWVTDKTVNGFTINVDVAPGGNQVLRWMLWR